MIIGLIVLDLHLPHARSLKEKRMALNRIRDRIRQKFNAAYAELDFQDVWQRARLGIVTINSRKSVVEGQLQAVLKDVERTFEGETIVVEVQYF
jgi:uncharacterized protein YlxP (DUF503 family)